MVFCVPSIILCENVTKVKVYLLSKKVISGQAIHKSHILLRDGLEPMPSNVRTKQVNTTFVKYYNCNQIFICFVTKRVQIPKHDGFGYVDCQWVFLNFLVTSKLDILNT